MEPQDDRPLPKLHHLPPELLDHIMFFLPPTSIVHLMVNKKLRSACEQFLYEDIDVVDKPNRSLHLLRTFVLRPDLALLVRRFRISLEWCIPGSTNRYRIPHLLQPNEIAALSLAKNIRSLALPGLGWLSDPSLAYIYEMVSQIELTSLDTIENYSPDSDIGLMVSTLRSRLLSLPKLEDLSLNFVMDSIHTPTGREKAVLNKVAVQVPDIPSLNRFRGDVRSAKAFLNAATELSTLDLSFQFTDPLRLTPTIMAALPSYSATPDVPAYSAEPTDTLPGYNESGTSAPLNSFVSSRGINDKLPNHFKINNNYVVPQLMPSDLEAHVVLLGAFHRLKQEVLSLKGVKADIPMEPEERWAVFLQRAVYRFEQWAIRMVGGEGEEDEESKPRVLKPNEVPPLDVMMDGASFPIPDPDPALFAFLILALGSFPHRSFPLVQLASSIDQETLLPHPAAEGRVAAFGSFTGQPFEPPINTTSEETVAVFCPSCSQPNTIPWITYKGDGYAQRAFACACSHCKFEFNTETLGVLKFFQDLEKFMMDTNRNFMANTVLDYQSGLPVDPQMSNLLCLQYLRLREGMNPIRPESLGKQIGWTFKALEAYCRKGLMARRDKPHMGTPRQLNILIAPYRSPGLASLDLASAVMRQMGFIEKMVNLGFTEPGRWEEDNDTLTRCVVRYHHFLDVMAAMPGKFAVPTLDIDLAWHTHQLLCNSYRKLKDIIGIVPDHDDKVGQGALSTAYDNTAEVWKERFGVPYAVCGCIPLIKTLDMEDGVSSSSGFSLFSKKGKSKADVPEKPITNPRPDLISTSNDAAGQTHASDHDSVAIINPGQTNKMQAQMRRQELSKRAKELGKAVAKGKADGWAEAMSKREVGHTPSFLCPVHYGAVKSFGKFGQGDCTAYSGGAVEGNFQIGECVKGNGMYSLCVAQVDQVRGGPEETVKYSAIMRGDSDLMGDQGWVVSAQFTGYLGGFGDV
ncbi:hypothetical protein FS837_012296 [Tulasnella sp. UAMH 9824]|nr:hypothetical protein FS837_012296 [Tulasnella sp. UAMH 9824]